MTTPRNGLSCLLLAAFTAACTDAPSADCEIDAPLAPVVTLPAAAVSGAPEWRVEEVWRAGALHGDADLTVPTSARAAGDGRVAIPDFATATVWVLDPDGQWLAPVGGRGQGPGELQAPIAVAWRDDGALRVLDAGQNKLELFDLAAGTTETESVPDDLLSAVIGSGEVGWSGLRADGMAFVETPSRGPDETTVRFLAGGPGDGAARVAWESAWPAGTVPAYDRPTRPDWPRPLLAVGPDGWAVAPSSARYEIVVFDGLDEAAIHLCVAGQEPATAHPDAPEVPEELARDMGRLASASARALFSRVLMDRDGRLWVERHLPAIGSGADRMYGVAGASYDVLTAGGAVVARVTLPAGWRLQDALGEHVWAFEVGPLGEVDVVKGRLVAGG